MWVRDASGIMKLEGLKFNGMDSEALSDCISLYWAARGCIPGGPLDATYEMTRRTCS